MEFDSFLMIQGYRASGKLIFFWKQPEEHRILRVKLVIKEKENRLRSGKCQGNLNLKGKVANLENVKKGERGGGGGGLNNRFTQIYNLWHSELKIMGWKSAESCVNNSSAACVKLLRYRVRLGTTSNNLNK